MVYKNPITSFQETRPTLLARYSLQKEFRIFCNQINKKKKSTNLFAPNKFSWAQKFLSLLKETRRMNIETCIWSPV